MILRAGAALAVLIASATAGAHLNMAKTAAPPLAFELRPAVVTIGTFYDGAQIRVSGEAAAGSKIVVVVRGDHAEETFHKKARVGPFWINSGKVRVSRAPSLFLAFSSERVRDFLPREVIDEYELDETAVQHRMLIDSAEGPIDDEVIRNNYHELKSEKGIYQIVTDGIHRENAQGAVAAFFVEFDWPKMARPGSYSVSAYECLDGRVVRTEEVRLGVTLVGFSARIHKLAMEHASLYGIAAVCIALLAGIGIDFMTQRVFGEKPKLAQQQPHG